MTLNPCSIGGDTPLAEVVQLMEQDRIRHLPVIDGGDVIGMVSQSDLMRAIRRLARASAMTCGNI